MAHLSLYVFFNDISTTEKNLSFIAASIWHSSLTGGSISWSFSIRHSKNIFGKSKCLVSGGPIRLILWANMCLAHDASSVVCNNGGTNRQQRYREAGTRIRFVIFSLHVNQWTWVQPLHLTEIVRQKCAIAVFHLLESFNLRNRKWQRALQNGPYDALVTRWCGEWALVAEIVWSIFWQQLLQWKWQFNFAGLSGCIFDWFRAIQNIFQNRVYRIGHMEQNTQYGNTSLIFDGRREVLEALLMRHNVQLQTEPVT